MLVHRADTGVIYNVDVNPEVSVEQLKETLSRISSIPLNQQVLLCGGTKLERGQKLQNYGLPSQEKGVFLFDRRMLEPGSPLPPDVILPSIELQIKFPPPLPASEELEKSPLVWSLMKFENEFLGDLSVVEGLKQTAEARLNICKASTSEQEVQMKAIEVAVSNLNEHYSQIMQAFTNFKNYFVQLQERHRLLLQTFDSDMQKLHDTKLHSALAKEGMITLMDFLPESRLRKWAEECAHEHNQLSLKVNDLEKQISLVKEGVEIEFKRVPEVDFKSLYSQLQKANDILSEVTLRSELFQTDYRSVHEKKITASVAESKQPLWNLSDGLDDIKKIHGRYLQTIKKHDETLKQIVTYFATSKTRSTRHLHERLCTIALLQSKIRDLANKIIVFQEALARQKTAFHQLLYVQSMPKAYHAALDEVSRRRKFVKKLNNVSSKISDALSKLRKEEYEKRKSFLDSYGRFIPRDLIPGLMDALPPFELNIPPFDSALPPINIETSNEDEDFMVVLSDERSPRLFDLEMENQKLHAELKTLKSDLGNSKNNSDLRDSENIYKLKTDLLHSQESASDYRKRIEALEMKLSTTYSQVEQAEALVKHFKDRYESAEVQLQKIEAEASQLMESHQMFESLEQNLVQSNREVESLSQRLKNYEIEHEKFIKKIQETEREKVMLNTKVENLEEKIENTMKQLKESETKKEALLKKLQEETQQFKLEKENLKKELQEVQSRESSHKMELEALRIKLEQADNEQKELLSKYNTLNEECNKNSEVSKCKIEQLDGEKVELQRLEQQLKEKNRKLNQELENHLANVAQRENKLEAQGKQIEDLNTEKVQLQATNEKFNTALSQSMRKIEQLDSLLRQKDEQLKKIQEESSQGTEQQQQNVELISSCGTKIRELEYQLASERRKLESSQADIDLYKSKVHKLEEEKTQINELLSQAYYKANKIEEEKFIEVKKINEQLQMTQESTKKIEEERKKLVLMYAEVTEKCGKLDKEKLILMNEIMSLNEDAKKVEQELQAKIAECEEKSKALVDNSSRTLTENKVSELEKQVIEKETELQKMENKFQVLSQKFMDAVKQLDIKNKQNADIMRNSSLQEKKFEEEKLQLGNYSSTMKSELEVLKQGLQQILYIFPNTIVRQDNLLQQLEESVHKLVEQNQLLDRQYKEIVDRNQALELTLEHRREENKKRIQDLDSTITALRMELESKEFKPSLSFANFKPGEVVIFLPNKNGYYEAYNKESPHYYLAQESLANFEKESKQNEPIFGQIVQIQAEKASLSSNPYNLPQGTAYFDVIVSNL